MRRRWIVLAGSMALVFGACNQRVALTDSPVSPTAATSPTSLPPIQPDVATVNLTHMAVRAGDPMAGVVNLYASAGDGGAVVSLSSSDSAASVPSTVKVAPGERTAEFTVTTARITEDRHLRITATTPGKSVVAALSIWAEFPEFFMFFSDPDEPIGDGGFNRMLPGDTTFEGGCQGSEVHIELLSPMSGDWLLRFKAPEGEPLRAGAYEGVTAIASNRPHATMSVAGREESCTTVAGRFVIHEIDLTGDRVNRLRLSFEQRCDGNPATLHGELSVANLNVAGTSTTASLR